MANLLIYALKIVKHSYVRGLADELFCVLIGHSNTVNLWDGKYLSQLYP